MPEGRVENWVVLGALGPLISHRTELHEVVLRYLLQAGVSREELVGESLEQLVAKAIEHSRGTLSTSPAPSSEE